MHGEDGEPAGGAAPSLPEPPRRPSVSARSVLVAIAVVVLVVFAAVNFEPVEVDFVLFDTRARVVTVIVVAAALGFVAGFFTGRPSREERKRLREHDQR
jgi:uncharacterized integral membrane protein